MRAARGGKSFSCAVFVAVLSAFDGYFSRIFLKSAERGSRAIRDLAETPPWAHVKGRFGNLGVEQPSSIDLFPKPAGVSIEDDRCKQKN
jgi:hypothetical protein